jgi:hypothetical protein
MLPSPLPPLTALAWRAGSMAARGAVAAVSQQQQPAWGVCRCSAPSLRPLALAPAAAGSPTAATAAAARASSSAAPRVRRPRAPAAAAAADAAAPTEAPSPAANDPHALPPPPPPPPKRRARRAAAAAPADAPAAAAPAPGGAARPTAPAAAAQGAGPLPPKVVILGIDPDSNGAVAVLSWRQDDLVASLTALEGSFGSGGGGDGAGGGGQGEVEGVGEGWALDGARARVQVFDMPIVVTPLPARKGGAERSKRWVGWAVVSCPWAAAGDAAWAVAERAWQARPANSRQPPVFACKRTRPLQQGWQSEAGALQQAGAADDHS